MLFHAKANQQRLSVSIINYFKCKWIKLTNKNTECLKGLKINKIWPYTVYQRLNLDWMAHIADKRMDGKYIQVNDKQKKRVALLSQSFWMWRPPSIHAHSKVSTTPLTSIVKSSLLMHAQASPLSLAARLHWCCTNHSCYIDNGWTFSRQTYTHTCISICRFPCHWK